ncbi:MAG TPA: hypothetical protein VFQ05_09465 [Candidatus Eisenbacteria bacterium]|nr:hypothetical protein [Candidatus Eisenbacteria bacterium]
MSVSRTFLALSIVAALLAAVTSLAGILGSDAYARETPAWAVQAVGQDCANLLVAGVLSWSVVLLRRDRVLPLFVWLGCLLYLIYAFAIYAFAVHFNRWFLAYVAVLGTSFYAMAGTLVNLDLERTTAPLREHPHRRGAGLLLILIGVMFSLLWLSEIVPHALSARVPATLVETGLWTNPVHVLDLAFLLPGMIMVGVLGRRQHPWGLVLLVPMLVFSATMGIGILAFFALSARRDFPVALPAAAIVGIVVLASVLYVALLLAAPVRSAGRG